MLYTSRALRLDCSYESVWTDLLFFSSFLFSFSFTPMTFEPYSHYDIRSAIGWYGSHTSAPMNMRHIRLSRSRTFAYEVRAFVNFMQKIQRHWEANQFRIYYRRRDGFWIVRWDRADKKETEISSIIDAMIVSILMDSKCNAYKSAKKMKCGEKKWKRDEWRAENKTKERRKKLLLKKQQQQQQQRSTRMRIDAESFI